MRLKHNRFIQSGLFFSCQRCGNCCRARHNVQHVYPAPPDIDAIAAFLEMTRQEFLIQHCDVDEDHAPFFKGLCGDCRFLGEGNTCRIYAVRPAQCRAWPFWIENLNPETWNNAVMSICPGAGNGRLWSAEEIDRIAALRDETEGFVLPELDME